MSAVTTTQTIPTRQRYAPVDHAAASTLKPVKVLEAATTGEHGPWALIEFDGGFTRIIDLPTHKDASHPVFNSLEWGGRWRLREVGAWVVPVGDSTTKIFKCLLSFTSETYTKRGKWLANNCFDVPDENHEEGKLTGYRAARELLQAMRADADFGGSNSFVDILKDASAAAAVIGGHDNSRMWAARGFFEVLEGVVRGAAKHMSCENYIDRLTDQHIESVRHTKAYYAGLNAQRVAKSVATRKARAASRKEARKVLPLVAVLAEVEGAVHE